MNRSSHRSAASIKYTINSRTTWRSRRENFFIWKIRKNFPYIIIIVCIDINKIIIYKKNCYYYILYLKLYGFYMIWRINKINDRGVKYVDKYIHTDITHENIFKFTKINSNYSNQRMPIDTAIIFGIYPFSNVSQKNPSNLCTHG